MIYFDNSATTWPKPDRVYRGVYEFMKKYGANPGRGGHYMAQKASEAVYECREVAARLLGIDDCSKIIFTKNTTEALNMVIKGVLKPGDHAVCTSMEHNSVYRPLDKMSKNGVKFDIVQGDKDGIISPGNIEDAILPETKLVIVNHMSNVCGTIQDIEAISEIVHRKGALLLVDCAQSGGLININMNNVDFAAFAGHKGFYGPMGTGMLCINCDTDISSLTEGGTGSYSDSIVQPEEFPDRLESGTLNAPGIAGLCEGMKFVSVVGLDRIYEHEMKLTKYFTDNLRSIKGITMYGPDEYSKKGPVVAFNKAGMDCVTLAQKLNDKFSIASRAGYHCAYKSHQTIGSVDGCVRFSFGRFNTIDEVGKSLKAIELI